MANNLENLNFQRKEGKQENKENLKKLEEYLSTVGLQPEDLKNKEVLDIGANMGELAARAKEEEIKITSLEKNSEYMPRKGEQADIPYVQGDANELPFKDNSFDVVISRAAPPIISPSADKEEVKRIVKEAERVLKEEGEFYFGPAGLDAAIFSKEEMDQEVGGDFAELNAQERIEKIKEKSIDFLKSINPDIEYIKEENEETGDREEYFVLKKEPEEEEEEKYYNEDYIEIILVNDSEEEINKMKEIHNLNPDQIELLSKFAKLRRSTLGKMEREVESRKESNPTPTEEEESMGVFIEQIEPQVREVVLNLRNKGYDTYESGFFGLEGQRISFKGDYLKNFEFPQQTKEEFKKEGVEVIIEPNSIKVDFAEFKDLKEIENIWKKVEKEIPSLDDETKNNTTGNAK